jgi:hypothetical protein
MIRQATAGSRQPVYCSINVALNDPFVVFSNIRLLPYDTSAPVAGTRPVAFPVTLVRET